MDQNWYSQDLAPRPPKQQNYLWLWLLSAFVAFAALIIGMVIYVAKQLPPGKGFAEWIAESSGTDNSQRIDFRMSAATQRLEAARAAYAGKQLASDDVTPQDVEQIQTLLRELLAIMRTSENSAFEAKTSLPEFRDRVRQAPSLSITAMRQFRQEFDGWFTMYPPYAGYVARIELVAVEHDTADHTLIAYTWVFNSAYPERIAWYLRSNGNEMRIVDFEILDTLALESDESAREFSAAFTGSYWDNYGAVFEAKADSAMSGDQITAAKAEVTRLSQLPFPKSIAHWGYHRLALIALPLDNDLCLQMLAKCEELAPLPVVYWQRAAIFAELKDYAKATENLRIYTDLIGPGPECYQLEGQIADAQKDYEKANIAWVKLLSMDPGTNSVPWDFHHHMTLANSMAVADSIRTRPDSAAAAQKIATLFVTRERGDLAGPLLPIAESVDAPTPGLLALRAKIAQFNGDDEGYLSNLEQAWKAAPNDPEDSERVSWLYDWATALQSRGKGDEAIAKSPDPGQTFYDLAFVDDGVLYLNARELQVLSDALQNASANEESARKSLRVWQKLAPIAVKLQQRDYDAVWQSASVLFAKDASPDDRQIVELLDELELKWTAQDWLADAAVKTGHAIDVWDLLPEEGRLSGLLWRVDGANKADTVSALSERLRKDNPEDIDLIYCDALIASQNEDLPTALGKYQEFLRQPSVGQSALQYRARNEVADLAMKLTDWKSALADLPNDVLLNLIVERLKLAKRFDDAASVLEMARKRGATLPETIQAEASLLHEQQDWPALCALCESWLAERKAESSENFDVAYRSEVMHTQFVDALLMTGQQDRVDDVIAQLPDSNSRGTWKLRVAVAKNDQAAADSIFAEAETDSGASVNVSELGPQAVKYWSEEWRDFRQQHPIHFYTITRLTTLSTSDLILQSIATPLTAADLRTALQTVSNDVTVEDVTVEDLTELLAQTEQRAIAQMSLVAGNRDIAVPIAVSPRQLYRINLEGASFLVTNGSDSHHKPVGGKVGEMEASPLDDDELSEPLRQAIDAHQGWICVRAEADMTADADRVKALQAKITGALLNDLASVVILDGKAALMSADAIATLTSGSTSSLKNTESYSSNVKEPLMNELDKQSTVRLRALRKRLSEIPEESVAPKITLLLKVPGASQRDRTLIEYPLLQWEPKAFPTEFTVRFGDSPLVAPGFRGELAKTPAWSVIGWREE